MDKPEYLVEWDFIVKDAKEHLIGDCPLLEDEVIVLVDGYLKALEEFKFMYESVSK